MYLQNNKIMKKLGISKLKHYLASMTGDFINRNLHMFSKLPIDAIDSINKHNPTVFIGAPKNLEECNNEIKHSKYGAHSMNTTQNKKEPFIASKKEHFTSNNPHMDNIFKFIKYLPNKVQAHPSINTNIPINNNTNHRANFYNNVFDFENDPNPNNLDDTEILNYILNRVRKTKEEVIADINSEKNNNE